MRNTVPVPRHWSYKRKYLQGKRGIEKPPFDLPDFIKVSKKRPLHCDINWTHVGPGYWRHGDETSSGG